MAVAGGCVSVSCSVLCPVLCSVLYPFARVQYGEESELELDCCILWDRDWVWLWV